MPLPSGSSGILCLVIVVPGVLPDGSVVGPDGTVFQRTSRRLKRKDCETLIGSGAPILTEMWPEPLTWLDGADAAKAWAGIAPRFVTGPLPKKIDTQWWAHLWESDDGRPLIRFDGRH